MSWANHHKRLSRRPTICRQWRLVVTNCALTARTTRTLSLRMGGRGFHIGKSDRSHLKQSTTGGKLKQGTPRQSRNHVRFNCPFSEHFLATCPSLARRIPGLHRHRDIFVVSMVCQSVDGSQSCALGTGNWTLPVHLLRLGIAYDCDRANHSSNRIGSPPLVVVGVDLPGDWDRLFFDPYGDVTCCTQGILSVGRQRIAHARVFDPDVTCIPAVQFDYLYGDHKFLPGVKLLSQVPGS